MKDRIQANKAKTENILSELKTKLNKISLLIFVFPALFECEILIVFLDNEAHPFFILLLTM